MVPQKLFDYLSAKKKSGYPDTMIKDQFLKQGWSLDILNEAYDKLNNVAPKASTNLDQDALFVTPDGVLVKILSPKASDDKLIELANKLK